jgi:hypothetical protein
MPCPDYKSFFFIGICHSPLAVTAYFFGTFMEGDFSALSKKVIVLDMVSLRDGYS